MSNHQDPNLGQQPVVRHRRSERHRQAGAHVQPEETPVQQPLSAPQDEDVDEIKWQRRAPDNWPEENAQEYAQPASRRRSSRAPWTPTQTRQSPSRPRTP